MAGTSKERSEIIENGNMFALDVYLAIKDSAENIVVSPIGLQILLAMAQQGAKGATSSEIAKVLYQKENNKEVLCDYKKMIKGLESQFLKLATSIFIEKTFEISPDFQKLTSCYFLARATMLDFKSDRKGSVKEINKWAAENTNDKIKNLLSEDAVKDDTVLILANALHFKAKWLHKFDENLTSDQPFYITPNNAVTVPMMSLKEEKLEYAESEKLKANIIRLPYVGNEFSMIIIVPKERGGLSEVETELQSANLNEEFLALEKMEVNLLLPRFKIENCRNLNNALSEMGMPTAFSPEAEFSGISKTPLYISDVVQKAYIEVNEEGTEAAAATGLVFTNYCLKISPCVKCDHPFLYFVLKQNVVLFCGQVSDPSKM